MNNLAGPEPVAIIGMAGRFPGAIDIGQFWAGLRGGVQAIRFRSDDELLAAGVRPEELADPGYVRATATAPEIDGFDAGFFGLTPRQARMCDPQARLFLECAHAALQDAGYDAEQLTNIGVFGSAGANRYLELVRNSTETEANTPDSALTAWNSPDRLASLVSRQLGLHGPTMAVQADDASSLVAVHLACASLHAGECELAVAGGVEVELPLGRGYRWEPGGELSRDGSCRPFDKSSNGTVPGSGAGVVVLKRLSAAVADRDHVWAVIRSTAVNNDGARAESGGAARGQSTVITRAMSLAGVHPEDLSLIEASATGHPTTDRTEVAALKAVFDRIDEQPAPLCALTSVKGNVGHLRHAAGIASLIKVVLALAHEIIPPNVGFHQPSPALHLDGSPFFVPGRAVPWPRQEGHPRVAGVSAFGQDGTNAHAIVSEAPHPAPVRIERRPHVVVWSARTPAAAERYRERLAAHFDSVGDHAFVTTVATLQRGRTPFPHRRAVVAADAAAAAALLRDPDPASRLGSSAPGQHSRIAFLFPGQGAQHAGVAEDLYEWSPTYAKAFDECLDLFEEEGLPLRRWWREGSEDQLHSPLAALPLTFSVEHALARAWQSWGITPDAVLGLSIGEMTAAAVAGVFTLEDVVRAIASRSQAVHDSPAGGLLAVSGSRDEVEPLLPPDSWIAVIGGPRQLVVTGLTEVLDEVAAVLDGAGLPYRPVPATRAVHGRSVAAAVPAFEQVLRGLHLAPPRIGFYSAITGRLASPTEATDPEFWARQLVQPVLFADALDALTAAPGRLLMIEVGAGQTLTTLAQRHPTVVAGRHRALTTLTHRPAGPLPQVRAALAAVASVWTEGQAVHWSAVESLTDIGRTSVPGYPYERVRHWIEPAAERPADAGSAGAGPTDAGPAGPDRRQPARNSVSSNGTAPASVAVKVPVAAEPSAAAVETRPAPVSTVERPVQATTAAADQPVQAAGPITTADRLRSLWSTVLGAGENIPPDADFFDLGGNSLTAVELMTKVRAEFGVELGVLTLFDHSTLDALADQIDRRRG
jgi:acyl transferase domain-containing protein